MRRRSVPNFAARSRVLTVVSSTSEEERDERSLGVDGVEDLSSLRYD